jgi:hypothetical protein
LPIEAAQFPGDDDASTWHVGVFTSGEENGAPLSCASFMLNSYRGCFQIQSGEERKFRGFSLFVFSIQI